MPSPLCTGFKYPRKALPAAAPTSYRVGTRVKGRDGRMWQAGPAPKRAAVRCRMDPTIVWTPVEDIEYYADRLDMWYKRGKYAKDASKKKTTSKKKKTTSTKKKTTRRRTTSKKKKTSSTKKKTTRRKTTSKKKPSKKVGLSKETRYSICEKKTTKKYRERKSPPYSAQDCPNMSRRGNDGQTWVSTKVGRQKFFTWKKSS